MHPLIESFSNRGLKRGGLVFFTPAVALELIEALRMANVPILGLDAVRVGRNSTQPSMEHSADFSNESGGAWDEARAFLSANEKSDLLFEVVAL
jgi:hypothetical protein